MGKGTMYSSRCHFSAPIASKDEDRAAFWPYIDPQVDWCGSHPERRDTRPITEADVVGIFRKEMEQWAKMRKGQS
jgi:hypothetical protein